MPPLRGMGLYSGTQWSPDHLSTASRSPSPFRGGCLAEFALARRHMFRIIRFGLKGQSSFTSPFLLFKIEAKTSILRRKKEMSGRSFPRRGKRSKAIFLLTQCGERSAAFSTLSPKGSALKAKLYQLAFLTPGIWPL